MEFLDILPKTNVSKQIHNKRNILTRTISDTIVKHIVKSVTHRRKFTIVPLFKNSFGYRIELHFLANN